MNRNVHQLLIPVGILYLDVLAHNVVTLATAVNTCECSALKIWYKNYKNEIIREAR